MWFSGMFGGIAEAVPTMGTVVNISGRRSHGLSA